MADIKTHFPSDENLGRIATAVELMAGLSPTPSEMSYADIQRIVRAGKGSSVLKVGDQVLVPFSGNGYECTFRLDVLHHLDGSDDDHPLAELADGTTAPGVMLGWHNAVPYAIAFSPKEAFFRAESDLPAGTYNFTVNVTQTWGTGVAGTVGSVTYQFTLTKAMPKGSQIVWNSSFIATPTSGSVYSGPTSSSVVETVAISVGSSGTSLGTMSESSSDPGFNNIERACEGNGNWGASQLRQHLNAEGTLTPTYGGFSRPFPFAGKAGFLDGLDPDFVSVLAETKVQTEAHAFDGGAVETTYDKLFPLSARQHYFANYLGESSSGFSSSGVPCDYWKQFAAASGQTSTWSGWAVHPELTTYDAVATTTSRGVWLRSAYRDVSHANSAGCVYASGHVSNAGAAGGCFAVPACVIA